LTKTDTPPSEHELKVCRCSVGRTSHVQLRLLYERHRWERLGLAAVNRHNVARQTEPGWYLRR